MKTRDILEKYACYYDSIEAIAKFPFDFFPTMKEAAMGRREIQRAYKEREKINFKGDIIDYVCYIAMMYAILISKRSTPIEIAKYWQNDTENQSVIRDALRLFRKKPDYFYKIVGSNWDREASAILDNMWHVEGGFSSYSA